DPHPLLPCLAARLAPPAAAFPVVGPPSNLRQNALKSSVRPPRVPQWEGPSTCQRTRFMPLHLPPFSRRQFLRTAAVALGPLVVGPVFGREEKTDPHRLAWLADTHIPDKPAVVNKEWNRT